MYISEMWSSFEVTSLCLLVAFIITYCLVYISDYVEQFWDYLSNPVSHTAIVMSADEQQKPDTPKKLKIKVKGKSRRAEYWLSSFMSWLVCLCTSLATLVLVWLAHFTTIIICKTYLCERNTHTDTHTFIYYHHFTYCIYVE